MYQDYRKVYYGNNAMHLKSKEIIKKRPLYVIDNTRYPENISEAKSNIIVYINFSKTLTAPSDGNVGNTVYIAIVFEKVLTQCHDE